MPRIKCKRNIESEPNVTYYKPVGIPLRELQELELDLDELEAIRLSDYEGLYQEEAAEKMHVSRQTFGRIINNAHRKIAECLIKGKAIKINVSSED